MTREEAVERLKHLQADYNDKYIDYEGANDAYNMAISSLQTEPCEDAISRSEAMNILDALYLDGESAQRFTADANGDCLIGKYKAIELLDDLPSVQPTVCIAKISFDDQQMKEMIDKAISDLDFSDLISRQAAIDELVRWGAIPEYNEAEKNILACCIGMLSTLPSVQPTQKIGKWIDTDNYYQRWKCSECGCHTRDAEPNFCPNCGCRMMKEGE